VRRAIPDFRRRMEPIAVLRRVVHVSRAKRSDEQRELAALYASSYARLVSVVAAVGGDRVEAEDAVQEAFIRLIDQWERVSRYDSPEAWLRRVALGMVNSRRRKVRNGIRALRRHGVAPDAPAVNAAAIDVHRALLALPVHQREVVVLVHVVGLDLAEVARELAIPIGTVKSRLSRARAALAPLLAEELTPNA
jgi:RNA polymerase sigma-70 factor (ECF subfamily)